MQECKVYITLQSCNLEFLILGGTYERETNSDITEAFYYARKCFVLDMEVDCEEIKKELNRKLDAVALRQLYSTYKTAPTDAEKEEARQKYLDAKGVPTSFRW